MIGFALDDKGDLLIENNKISIVAGDSLLQQKINMVLQTNPREWFFDWEEGVDFKNLVGKSTNAEIAQYEIEKGLAQVDETFVITEFAYEEERATRKARVKFKARTESGKEVGGDVSWA